MPVRILWGLHDSWEDCCRKRCRHRRNPDNGPLIRKLHLMSSGSCICRRRSFCLAIPFSIALSMATGRLPQIVPVEVTVAPVYEVAARIHVCASDVPEYVEPLSIRREIPSCGTCSLQSAGSLIEILCSLECRIVSVRVVL